MNDQLVKQSVAQLPAAILGDTNSNFTLDSDNTPGVIEKMTLVHGDQDTANRLLSQAKLKNSNQSTDWCVEKVIYDLERDRGMY